jgi:superfamily II DNA or RNA helicase
MSAKSSHFNSFGQILWNRWDLTRELRAIATYNIYYGTYVTSPATLSLARDALTFARQHNIEIQPWGKSDLALHDPESLMEVHNARMFELSRADITNLRLTRPLKEEISQFVLTGIQYALLSQRCIIADPSPEDRMAIALGTIHQRECYPCLIVCGKDERKHWHEKIQALLPKEVQVLDVCDVQSTLPEKAILFAEHSILERHFRWPTFPRRKDKAGTSLIVDEAHLFKNPEARRTQNLLSIRKGVSYRLLLTDYLVDLSYQDLRILLRILDRESEFEDLYDSLRTASRDPLVNASRNLYRYGHQTVLRRLHFKLRANCMVRRADDRELGVQERSMNVGLTNGFPAEFDPEEIKHPLHVIGAKKAESAIAWLRLFLQGCKGKILIFAHHNDVVEKVAEALGIPAYHGKTGSEKERNRIIQDFRHGNKFQALMVANDMELEWDLPEVSHVVFVEMPRSLSKYENVLNRVAGDEGGKSVSVYFLVSENLLDKRAQYRLQFREKEYEIIMDGDISR